jgi:hypothetical protein
VENATTSPISADAAACELRPVLRNSTNSSRDQFPSPVRPSALGQARTSSRTFPTAEIGSASTRPEYSWRYGRRRNGQAPAPDRRPDSTRRIWKHQACNSPLSRNSQFQNVISQRMRIEMAPGCAAEDCARP